MTARAVGIPFTMVVDRAAVPCYFVRVTAGSALSHYQESYPAVP
ncbi:hypothetical protein LX83_005955 [Goodfellowiella coeruleoviolacea]|uniref:Uncharacterized protein n=1 Tax=Goodfellowiella coeruleoviolacea TaxID=334858 RepID=A0AAE3GJ20_9PSEU|nr:hypothetical protein [Goodfellowiella coeruleoviolacea]